MSCNIIGKVTSNGIMFALTLVIKEDVCINVAED